MSKKTKIPKRDLYLLILGFVLGFLGEMAYDVAHEFAFAFNEKINWYWVFLQVCFLVLFGVLAYGVLRKVDQEI